ncbi:hypothetical protein [Streptomyces tropicalis]|uniref:Integral membrane protein n=1 Tax=Streptomyces tropicalis TaxID=3034234 RepID=A0ABT5ZZ02_9ACTN|nr:hypothetical protein [Streptomyces tropicalis]MDF3297612.1 hypothetical protein [Streptomyces tropicalis]
MASRASSDAPLSGSPARIPSLPGLGTSWYERGPRYWLRRVLSAAVWLAVLAFACWVVVLLYLGEPRSDLPPTARTVWDGVQIAASCVAVVRGWVVQRRGHRRKLQDPPTPGQAAAARRDQYRRTPGLVLAGRFALLIAAPVLPACMAFAVGWLTAAFTVRAYPSELGARRWLAAH